MTFLVMIYIYAEFVVAVAHNYGGGNSLILDYAIGSPELCLFVSATTLSVRRLNTVYDI